MSEEHVLGISERTGELSPRHNSFSESEGKFYHTILGLLVADWIEIDAAGNTGQSGEVVAFVFASAYFLHDYGHLLLRDNVSGSSDVAA